MGRIWKADGEEKVSDVLVSDPAPGHQTLLRGQTTIGLDGRLKRADAVPGEDCVIVMIKHRQYKNIIN